MEAGTLLRKRNRVVDKPAPGRVYSNEQEFRLNLIVSGGDRVSSHPFRRDEVRSPWARSKRSCATATSAAIASSADLGAQAEAELARLAEAGEDVALVPAGEGPGGAPGSELLGGVRSCTAPGALLIDYGSWGNGETAGDLRGDGAAPDRLLPDPSDPPSDDASPGDLDSCSSGSTPRISSHTAYIVASPGRGGRTNARGARPMCAAAQILLADSDEGAGGRRGRRRRRLPLVVFPTASTLSTEQRGADGRRGRAGRSAGA